MVVENFDHLLKDNVLNSFSMRMSDGKEIVAYSEVESKIAIIREQQVIADADIAELYGVETRRINEAVRNNPDKFPEDYMFELNKSELRDLRSKISITKVSRKSRSAIKVFTEIVEIWKSQIVMSNSIRMGMRRPPALK